jgi:hypothetical protein
VPTPGDPERDPRRNRRGTDPLALGLFRLLSPLTDDDKRCVLQSLEAIGPHHPVSPERLGIVTAAVERYQSETGRSLSKRSYEHWRREAENTSSLPSATFIANTFGSWAKATDALGFEPHPRHLGFRLRAQGAKPTDEMVVEDLRRCAQDLGVYQLRFRQYRKWALEQERAGRALNTLLISPNTFLKRFGGFASALRQAGLEPVDIGPRTRVTENTEARMLSAVREASKRLGGRRITLREYDALREQRWEQGVAVPAGYTIRRAYGTWSKVLVAAGLAHAKEADLGYGRGRGRKVTKRYMARCLLAAAGGGELPSLKRYEKWRHEELVDTSRPRPCSSAVVCNRIAPWIEIRKLVAEAQSAPDPEVQLERSLRRAEQGDV